MNFTGKQFEQLCIYRMGWEKTHGRGYMERANVAGAQFIGHSELLEDRVDFRGEAVGIKFKMEAKTCTNASFSLHQDFFKRGQYDELVSYKGVAFLMVHFNPRRLSIQVTAPRTFAFPIWTGHELWKRYESGDCKSLGIKECLDYGQAVTWNSVPRSQKLTPDIIDIVQRIKALPKKIRKTA